MAATQIAEMRPTHDRILDHILARPHATLRELSQVTGYSISWLSQITRSNCFREEYEARRQGIECEVMMGVGERLNALAHLAIDKMEEKLVVATDPDFIVDAFDKVLHRTGYAPNAAKSPAGGNGQPSQQTNIFLVDKETLAQCRETIVGGNSVPVPALEGEVKRVSDDSLSTE